MVRLMKPGEWIPVLRELADRADEVSRRYFRAGDLHVRAKPDRTLVTQADLEVESRVRDLIAQREPDLGVFGEEHGEQGSDATTRLIIDPIDATANFARGLPIFATLLAIEHEGQIIAGFVSAPALHQRWHAAKGEGAWASDRRLWVSQVEHLQDAQVFHGSLYGAEAVPNTARIPALLQRSWRQRGLGDFYQHVLVAEGCGEIACDPVVAPWDVAPLKIIVEEAGGRASTLQGESNIRGGSWVSTNGLLHDVVLGAFA